MCITWSNTVILYYRLLPVKITQVILLILAIISLFTTTFVVSAGWAKTCKTYRDIGKSTDAFSCTGYQDNSQSTPHGGEIIASAVRYYPIMKSLSLYT